MGEKKNASAFSFGLNILQSCEINKDPLFFHRSSSRPDLIAITPIYDDLNDIECASKAVLTTLYRERRRSTALVLAKGNEILRCDVILDIIDQLGVLTTTRELYLEEAPETFELWAQDSQGKCEQ